MKEKVDKAAKREAYDNSDRSYNDRRDEFTRGVEWLMSQPLSERLTKEDVKKLNGIVFLMRGFAAYGVMPYSCMRKISEAIYDIFGKDIFEPQRNCAVVNMDMLRQGNV